MSEPEPRLVFRGAAWKSGLRTLLCLAFVVAVAWILMEGGFETRRRSREVVMVSMAFCLVVSGFMTLLNFLKLCLPPELVLTPDGFSVRGLRKPRLVLWGDVQRFELIKTGVGASVAGYILKPNAEAGARDRWAMRVATWGVDGIIAVFPEETPGYVVKVLNDWRRRYAPSP
ncbi:hypothetical protein ACFPIF_04525 [Brevundimonas faecalis]|uniref:hypothetical protein n=1 Tax=Brevundimonas faecalis TaxID=947378 RepID=UPI0036183215